MHFPVSSLFLSILFLFYVFNCIVNTFLSLWLFSHVFTVLKVYSVVAVTEYHLTDKIFTVDMSFHSFYLFIFIFCFYYRLLFCLSNFLINHWPGLYFGSYMVVFSMYALKIYWWFIPCYIIHLEFFWFAFFP